MKNPIKRQLRARKKIERIARDLKAKVNRVYSPLEIRQMKNYSFRAYYTFCMNTPRYKRAS